MSYNQLFNMKNVFIKVNFIILKFNIIPYAINFSKNYYDESYDQILNLRAVAFISEVE